MDEEDDQLLSEQLSNRQQKQPYKRVYAVDVSNMLWQEKYQMG